MDTDNPAVVAEFSFTVHARTRDAGIARADEIANDILAQVGGEPWMMLDDDWQRVFIPANRLTICDHDGFMYQGKRSYKFVGPLVGTQDAQIRDGWRTQGVSD